MSCKQHSTAEDDVYIEIDEYGRGLQIPGSEMQHHRDDHLMEWLQSSSAAKKNKFLPVRAFILRVGQKLFSLKRKLGECFSAEKRNETSSIGLASIPIPSGSRHLEDLSMISSSYFVTWSSSTST